jgi:hypothetical protein
MHIFKHIIDKPTPQAEQDLRSDLKPFLIDRSG